MGEVDDDAERLAGIDRSIRPGTRSTRFEAGSDGRRVESKALAEGDDREGVVDVEAAGEPQLDGCAPPDGAS